MDESFFSPSKEMTRREEAFGYNGLEEDLKISKILYYLMEMQDFKKAVLSIFRDRMSGMKEEFISKVTEVRSQIGDAANRNDEKWNKNNTEEECDRLIEWLMARYDYFEKQYGENKLWNSLH